METYSHLQVVDLPMFFTCSGAWLTGTNQIDLGHHTYHYTGHIPAT